jgi:NifU-like protein involved in Fe-S cluster formation
MPRYSAKMLDHLHWPRNASALTDADIIGRGSLDGRPPCTEIYVKLADGVIQQSGFTTFGCGASIACASALTELITGRTLADCRGISGKELIDILDGIPPEKLYCAKIAFAALNDVICQWSDRNSNSIPS